MKRLFQDFGCAPKVNHFLNAEGAEVFAEVRSKALLCAPLRKLCVLCVKILFEIAHSEF
jgi:hypothetical protein